MQELKTNSEKLDPEKTPLRCGNPCGEKSSAGYKRAHERQSLVNTFEVQGPEQDGKKGDSSRNELKHFKRSVPKKIGIVQVGKDRSVQENNASGGRKETTCKLCGMQRQGSWTLIQKKTSRSKLVRKCISSTVTRLQ